jgi:predicted  nucleic acid-binding Zn-ribbon protein
MYCRTKEELEADQLQSSITTKKDIIRKYEKKISELDRNLCGGEEEYTNKLKKYRQKMDQESNAVSKLEVRFEQLMDKARKDLKEYTQEILKKD